MTIKAQKGPTNGLAVLQQALSARARSVRFSFKAAGPRAGSPVAVFHLTQEQLQLEDPLSAATQTTWRYPIFDGDRPRLADVRELGIEGPLTFAGLSEGVLVERFFAACLLAEESLAGEPEELAPRLLDVPELRFIALWLHGATQEYFISLLEGHPPGSAPLRIITDAVKALRERAESRARRVLVQASGPASSPTN